MNVNLDILELVFAHLQGSDLVASSLVSRAFLSGVIPTLYARISYTASHAKRAAQLTSPFTTLCTHKHLSVYVKHIAVHFAPSLPSPQHQVDPAFLKDLTDALQQSCNLTSFTCTVAKILTPLLPALKEKSRLTHLRVYASLGTRQVKSLQEIKGLRNLCLDFPSWNVIDVLPTWLGGMSTTLTHLTIFMSHDIESSILHATLEHLPRLRGLHIIGCLKLTHSVVLRALSHTPDLRELSLTIFPSIPTPPLPSTVPSLTHLSLDIRTSHPSVRTLVASLVEHLAPRQGLAVCGSWMGDITGELEGRTDANGSGGGGDGGLGGVFGPSHAANGHTHTQPNANANGAPAPPFSITPGTTPSANTNIPMHPLSHLASGADSNANANSFSANASGPTPANPSANVGHGTGPGPDPLSALISTLPRTLTSLHLPPVSPQALKEIVARCECLRVLGFGLGAGFSTPSPGSRPSGGANRRGSSGGSKPATGGIDHGGIIGVGSVGAPVRPEIRTLSAISSHARGLRILILDTSVSHSSLMEAEGGHAPGHTGGGIDGGGGRTETGSMSRRGGTLLSAAAVRELMKEAPRLRRVVGEGRIWQFASRSSFRLAFFKQATDTPPHTSHEPTLTLSPSRPVPFTGSSHGHGSTAFSMGRSVVGGGGYGQVEGSTSASGSYEHGKGADGHWFWLNGISEGN
ncbi:hypothetical protein F5I97DRAFT_1930608 [Phlebopus sp. FC_14]|nr:hypothetical protein F5I97DRAFT_1930608 [Phlebopus sp. FC_14]